VTMVGAAAEDPHASIEATISLTRSNLKTGALDKSLSKIRNEIHISCYALLFSEIVQYCQNRSSSLVDLKNRSVYLYTHLDLGILPNMDHIM